MTKTKEKTKQDPRNKRTFYITDQNLGTLQELGKILISKSNQTVLVNYAIDTVLAEWLRMFEIEAKTPAQKDELNLNLSKEVNKYASAEESFR